MKSVKNNYYSKTEITSTLHDTFNSYSNFTDKKVCFYINNYFEGHFLTICRSLWTQKSITEICIREK